MRGKITHKAWDSLKGRRPEVGKERKDVSIAAGISHAKGTNKIGKSAALKLLTVSAHNKKVGGSSKDEFVPARNDQ